jgi:hypothetical protein
MSEKGSCELCTVFRNEMPFRTLNFSAFLLWEA